MARRQRRHLHVPDRRSSPGTSSGRASAPCRGVASVAERVRDQVGDRLPLPDEQREVVREHVGERDRHERVRERARELPGREARARRTACRARRPGRRPRRSPIASSSPTLSASSSAGVSARPRPAKRLCTCGWSVSQTTPFEAPSNVVMPMIASTIADGPGLLGAATGRRTAAGAATVRRRARPAARAARAG